MNASLMFILLLAGTSWEGSGLTLQLQIGYTPAILDRGNKGYDYPSAGLFPELSEVLYCSHTFSIKAGVKTREGWELRGIGSLTYAAIPKSGINFTFPPEYSPIGLCDWTSHELSLGAELGHRVGFKWGKGSVYLGLEGVWGRLSGEPWDTFYVMTPTSKMLGIQGHFGLGIPLVSFGAFNSRIHPMLKGGFLKEQSANIPPRTEWLGPYTLSKWGIALGLTLNYNERKEK